MGTHLRYRDTENGMLTEQTSLVTAGLVPCGSDLGSRMREIRTYGSVRGGLSCGGSTWERRCRRVSSVTRVPGDLVGQSPLLDYLRLSFLFLKLLSITLFDEHRQRRFTRLLFVVRQFAKGKWGQSSVMLRCPLGGSTTPDVVELVHNLITRESPISLFIVNSSKTPTTFSVPHFPV